MKYYGSYNYNMEYKYNGCWKFVGSVKDERYDRYKIYVTGWTFYFIHILYIYNKI